MRRTHARGHRDCRRHRRGGDLHRDRHPFEANYRALRQMLGPSRLQGNLQPGLLIGNHDDRQVFTTPFSFIDRFCGDYFLRMPRPCHNIVHCTITSHVQKIDYDIGSACHSCH